MNQDYANAHLKFHTALYLRLSKEDRKDKESDSIANQRLLLHNYLEHHPEFLFYKEYIDDGETGTNFNRPQFQQMMDDLDKGLINCIICKDCSRFGRDYIECGSYVREFDDCNVRFIAINDNYDSFDQYRDDTIFAIKNVMNTEYSKAKSRDIKKIFKEKQYEGSYMGAFSIYGYKKSPDDKHKFVIDEYAANVVRRVFQMFCDGMAKQTIARTLTAEGILSPEEYKRANGSNFHTGRISQQKSWSYGAIHQMLQNQAYIGNTVQNKTYRKRMKGKGYKNPREKWIIVENTHEPIIDKELWDRTQKLFIERAKPRPDFSNISAIAGFVTCAECGARLTASTWGKGPALICGTYKRMGRKGCTPHLVPKQLIIDTITNDLNAIIANSHDIEDKINRYKNNQKTTDKNYDVELKKLDNRIQSIMKYKKKAFEAYQDELLSKNDFQNLQKQYEEEENAIRSMQNTIISSQKNVAENNQQFPWLERLLQKGKIEELDRGTVADTIDAIYVSDNKEIKIVYRFSDELETLIS